MMVQYVSLFGTSRINQKCCLCYVIIRIILDKLKIKPEEGLFVDDKQENLDAAEALGMKSLIFKTNGQFIGDITKLFEESESVRKEK